MFDCCFREYTQLAVRGGVTDYQYVDDDCNVATIEVEKYQISRQAPGPDHMTDLIDTSLVCMFCCRRSTKALWLAWLVTEVNKLKPECH